MTLAKRLEPTPFELLHEYLDTDQTYEQLGSKYGRSKSWVGKHIDDARRQLRSRGKGVGSEVTAVELIIEMLNQHSQPARERIVQYVIEYFKEKSDGS